MARRVIIIGAGVIGVASAYAFSQRGWQVTLIDQEEGPAMRTSHANGAQLSYCFTDALGSPATLASLPRLLFGKGGVSIGLSLDPDYLRWLTAFARNCTAGQFRKNTLAVLDLALQSRRAMEILCEQHDLDFAHRSAGKINLIYSVKERERSKTVMALKSQNRCNQEFLERAELEALDPALCNLDPYVIGAVSTASEAVGDPLLFCHALLEVLTKECGVKVRFDTGVSGVTESTDQAHVTLEHGEKLNADLVVVACGPDSNRLLAPLGKAVTIQPMKGYSFEMPVSGGSPEISVTDSKRRLVFTNLGDRMRVAGIAELGSCSRELDLSRIEWLKQAAKECLPAAGDYSRTSKFWTGLRPATPNSQPIIGRIGKRLAVNTGHGSLGWTLAMGSGEKLAELLDE